MAFPAQFNLSDLDGNNGFVINGIDSGDSSGDSVSSAGDINGDGLDDLIISAPGADPNGNSNAGESYVVFGTSSGFSQNLNLSTLDGSNGFVINGIDSYDSSGSSVSSAGDINGDGVDDLIIGAPGADPNGNSTAGESYVVFGTSSGFSQNLDLSNLDGSNGFVINGINQEDGSGNSVSSAGDINGDGVDDLIIGAPGASRNGNSYVGESYVVFGTSSGFSQNLDLSTLDGSNGFVINGIDMYDTSGSSVSSAGDINGDGVDDLIITAPAASPNGNSYTGQSYVVFGTSSGFSQNLDLSTLDGSNGFVINGINQGDGSGNSVSSAGDINGDGVDDLIIGASGASPNGNSYVGESYVVFGSSSGFSQNLDLSTLDGSNGFVINGIDTYDRSGSSVSSAGDINGDGVDDLIIGAISADPNGNSNAGETYVVFGSSSGFSQNLDLSTLDGSNGFVLNGIDSNDASGFSVSSAGDINGDGVDDLIIGADRADPNGNSNAGETYVVFDVCPDNTAPSAVDDAVTTDEDNALSGSVFADNGNGADSDPDGDTFTVTEVNGTAADVNNQVTLASGALLTLNSDGTFDYNPNGQFESLNDGDTASDSFSYTIDDGNGGTDTATVNVTINGVTDITPINEIIGTPKPDNLVGTPGRDLIRGKNGNDILEGRGDDDTIQGGRGGDIIFGGAGNDVLAADRVNRFTDFDGKVSEIRGGTGNDTIFGGRKNDDIGGGSDDDLLFGKRGDDLIRGADGNDTLNGGLGNDTLRGQNDIDTADYSDLTFNGVFGTVAGLDVNLSQNSALHSSNNNPLTWSDTLTTIENVIGTSRNDRFIGNADDNVFDGKGEVNRSDRQTTFTDLDGGDYQVIADVVEYSGNQSDFTILGSTDNFTVNGSGIGTDTLIDIEFLKFDDGLVAVDNSLFA